MILKTDSLFRRQGNKQINSLWVEDYKIQQDINRKQHSLVKQLL